MAVRRIVPDVRAAGDPAAGRGFYEDVLGLRLVMDLGWVVTYAPEAGSPVQLTVIGADASAPVPPDVSIEVDDVDAVHAAALRAGCEIVHPLTDEPWGVRRFFVRDPNGAVLNVLGHAPAAAGGQTAS